MKRFISVLLGLSFAVSLQAAPSMSVEVDWKSPDRYRDIDEGSTQSKKTFRKRLFRKIEESFSENMAKLPGDYNLKITMIDIDLAGSISRGLSTEIRTINDHDFPRLHFYAILENSKGEIVLQGEQNLKERKDKHKSFRMRGSQSEFYLETALIEKWFDRALVPALKK